MAITRRQFLQRSTAASGGLLIPSWLGHPLVRAAHAAVSDRFLVVIHLDGGNDGLNTITPIDDGLGSLRSDYELARTNLRLAALSLLPIGQDPATGANLGLNPALANLKGLYAQGHCAILQGVGYPIPNLSHDGSKRTWQTGRPFVPGPNANGWLGNFLIDQGYSGSDTPGVCIDESVVPSLRQSVTSILAFRNLLDFGFPYDLDYLGDSAAKRACYDGLFASAVAGGQEQLSFVGTTGEAALVATEAYIQNYNSDRSVFRSLYESQGTSVALDLLEVAKVIYGVSNAVPGMEAHFFTVRLPGFDTHAAQGAAQPGGNHYELLRALDKALGVFYADCDDMGMSDDLCVVVWGDFGRRVEQNGNGTDHGSQGPMLAIGGSVAGGLYGNHPNIAAGSLAQGGITAYSQNPGDPHRSLDFRDVYGTVLKHWLGMSEAAILSQILPPEPVGYDPNVYWVDGNHDFDLPFLPVV